MATTLHLLIKRRCLVPEILKCKELDTSAVNKKMCTPSDMLYEQDQVIDDQVKIKVALDHIQIDSKRNIFSSSVFLSRRREKKDVKFKEEAQKLIDGMVALMKENTGAVAKCYGDAIAGDPISRAALEMEADTPNKEGETILHVESKKGVIENVRFIVSALANKNLLVRLDNRKQTALYLAAHYRHTKVVEALLSAASRNLPPSSANDDIHNPVTPFQAYIRQANVPNKNTALHLAVLNNDVAIVKLLVEADPSYSHFQNNEGKTPIYIAAESGFKDVVKEICKTCTALSFYGPAGCTTALHALIQNLKQGEEEEEDRELIMMTVKAAKRWSSAEEALHAGFKALFQRTDESGRTPLDLAMSHNHVNAVELILQEDPAYHGSKNHGLLRLINQAMNSECSKHIVQLLKQAFEAGIGPDFQGVLDLIIAIQKRDPDTTSNLLEGANKRFLHFVDSEGWTLLHHAAHHQFDSMPIVMKETQEKVRDFVYRDRVATPFHVAAKLGYTSTLIRLMKLCEPSPLPYTTVDENGRNILHLAALVKQKEMVNGILRYCPTTHRNQLLSQKDTEVNTPLHYLVDNGCFIEDLIEDIARDTTKNKKHWIPREMLYSQYDIVGHQVQIKIALEDINTDKSWKLWPFTKKENTFSSSVPSSSLVPSSSSVLPSRRQEKDIMFSDGEKLWISKKNEETRDDVQRFREGTNSQTFVSALITTITFTVGFTVPGGLHQSGEINEGSAILSKKAAFKLFMISDALALLLSLCSLFIYFLQNMSQDLDQVTRLHATTVGLNIASVMLTMFVFMTGTYVVLSQSLALTITICVIGSLLFVFAIVQLLGVVYDRHRERKNEGSKKEA